MCQNYVNVLNNLILCNHFFPTSFNLYFCLGEMCEINNTWQYNCYYQEIIQIEKKYSNFMKQKKYLGCQSSILPNLSNNKQ